MLAGSPVSAEVNAWFYRNVKADLWLHVGSGGTDTCCGFTGGAPVLPVYAGEHQARNLGVAAYAFNERGEPVTGEVGEMVITQPMPSNQTSTQLCASDARTSHRSVMGL